MIDKDKLRGLLLRLIDNLEAEVIIKNDLAKFCSDSGVDELEDELEELMKSPELLPLSLRIGELGVELE